jgi:hypothetical protein
VRKCDNVLAFCCESHSIGGSTRKPTTRRQELVAELLRMDDDSMEEIWTMLVAELLRMDDDSMEEIWTMYTHKQKAKKRANTAQY